MYYLEIIDDKSCESHHATEQFGEWSEDTQHDIQGFRVVEEGKYHDLVVAFNPNKDRGYFLLYVLYGSGDSFGHSSGNICIVGLYEDEAIAEENAKRIVEQNERYKNSRDELGDDAYSVRLKDESGTEFKFHAPWNGYFEHLEDVVVHRVFREAKKSFVNTSGKHRASFTRRG